MTFDDDIIRFVDTTGKSRTISCVTAGIDWPPPEILNIWGCDYKLYRKSEITDEQREELTNVIRGAEYKLVLND